MTSGPTSTELSDSTATAGDLAISMNELNETKWLSKISTQVSNDVTSEADRTQKPVAMQDSAVAVLYEYLFETLTCRDSRKVLRPNDSDPQIEVALTGLPPWLYTLQHRFGTQLNQIQSAGEFGEFELAITSIQKTLEGIPSTHAARPLFLHTTRMLSN